jgi:murein L,D-transpeptidase YcbB/YkuD
MALTMAWVQPPSVRVVVNLPAYRLDMYVDDSVIHTLPVAVGLPRFPTPRGKFEITSVEWNPWWIPPDRDWAARERPTPPGPKNPMGRVKINFRPLYFLHGTPLESSIGTAASHGCIRLTNADAIALARLVHQYGSPALADVDALIASMKTQLVTLDVKIPLDLRYDLAEIRGETLWVHRDIYHIATRSRRDDVYAALAAVFIRRSGSHSMGIPIDSLRSIPRGTRARSDSRRAPNRSPPALAQSCSVAR